MYKKHLIALALCVVSAAAFADFVDDEFSGTSLGSQWTFSEGTSTGGNPDGTIEPATPPGYLSIIPGLGTTFGWDEHLDTNISQDQPTSATWDVRLKVDNWDPAQDETWQQIGLRLYQNDDRWLGINVTRRFSGGNYSYVLQAQSLFTTAGLDASPIGHKTELANFDFAKPEPLYLRLQKTSKGYRMGFSGDSVEWVDRGVFVRDPYTADGFLDPSAQIRVSATAPTLPTSSVTAEPVELDWIRALPLPEHTGPYADDEFTGNELDDRWLYNEGQYALPGIPGGYAVEDGVLKLTKSTGTELGQAYNSDRPQFVMQTAPTSENFALATKVAPANLTGSANWEGHGLRLWQDQNHWISVVVQRNSANPGVHNVESRYEFNNGESQGSKGVNVGTASDDAPQYLRVEKNGTKYRTLYSYDNVAWTPTLPPNADPDGWVEFGTALRNAQIQLLGKRPNSGRSVIVSEFDYIKEVPLAGVEDWQLF